jgi:hypothetical protein
VQIATKADADDVNDLSENLAAKDADLETQIAMATEQLNTNVDTLSTIGSGHYTCEDGWGGSVCTTPCAFNGALEFGTLDGGDKIPNNQISISSHSTCYNNPNRCAESSLDGNKGFLLNGLYDTLWTQGTEGYIIYDMGGARTISSVTIWNQGEYSDCHRHITGFDISYSDTAENSGFTTVAQPRGFTDCLQTQAKQATTQTVNGVSYQGTPDTITTEVAGGNSARYWKFEVPDECKPSSVFGIIRRLSSQEKPWTSSSWAGQFTSSPPPRRRTPRRAGRRAPPVSFMLSVPAHCRTAATKSGVPR